MGNKPKQIKSAGGVIVNDDGQIVVVSQAGKAWSLPKGHVENGEDEIETAKREIYEETGLKNIEFVKRLGAYKRHNSTKTKLKTITIFLFKTAETELNPVDTYHPEARWVDKENVAELLKHPEDKTFFTDISEKI